MMFKTANNIYYTRPANKGVAHILCAQSVWQTFPLHSLRAEQNVSLSHILFCSFKANALSIYPRFHSDKYKKHNCRIEYIPDRQIMLFLKRIAFTATVLVNNNFKTVMFLLLIKYSYRMNDTQVFFISR